MLDRVLKCFWSGFQACIIFKSFCISKVINDLLQGKTKKKEPNDLEKRWMRMMLSRTNSYIFMSFVICFTFYTAPSEVIFSHLTHALSFRWHLVMYHLITDIRWDILIFFLNILKKLQARRGRDSSPSSLLISYNTQAFWRTTSFKQTGTTTIFSFGYESCTWERSGSFCRKNPCSGFNRGIYLVVVLEYTFSQLCSKAE